MINLFDINVHVSSFLSSNKVLDTNNSLKMLEYEKKFNFDKLNFFNKHFNIQVKNKKINVNYLYNLMIFAQEINFKKLKNFSSFNCLSKTVLCNFSIKKKKDYILNLKKNKINAIKFHSYFQKILEKDYDSCIEISKICEKFNLPILIDCSFGGENLYKIKNLELAVEILKKVKKTPVILLHSGGLRILEAFLIAEQFNNVFLDTSFSVNYFNGFSILKNYIEVYKKIGADRIVYGSDFPYCDLKQSYNQSYNLIKKAFNNNHEIEKIFYKNAMKIFL